MRTSMIIRRLRRHASLGRIALAIFGLTAISLILHYDSIEILFTHGETKLNIGANRR